MKATQVLEANYEFTDEPLDTDDIPGLNDAIRRVQNGESESEIVQCEDRVSDYKVYWNVETETVRIGALVIKASYEVEE